MKIRYERLHRVSNDISGGDEKIKYHPFSFGKCLFVDPPRKLRKMGQNFEDPLSNSAFGLKHGDFDKYKNYLKQSVLHSKLTNF